MNIVRCTFCSSYISTTHSYNMTAVMGCKRTASQGKRVSLVVPGHFGDSATFLSALLLLAFEKPSIKPRHKPNSTIMKTALSAVLCLFAIPNASSFSIRPTMTEPHFVGTVVAEWCAKKDENCCKDDLEPLVPQREQHDCNRDMKLTQPFSFVDSFGTKWTAPKHFVIDGATIPKPLWFFFGSPYTGKYRRASVVHDYYCVRKNRHLAKQKDVHQMFYDAMRCDGVEKSKAWLMWFGVSLWGSIMNADWR